VTLVLAALALGSAMVSPPAPFGALPSPRQLAWHKLETYAFLHISPNTFTDREWGTGDEKPEIFNPTDFNANQIVESIQSAGMKGLILVCKHHDGLCLWPTKTTDHNISQSPWRNGKGDVVKEISDACHRHGMKFGVYLSPWDRNNAHYGQPEYPAIYRAQLTELLTHYGPIFEIWHDGANGGSGYYGGAGGSREIDRKTYYGWPETWELARKLQPNAVIFSDVGPDVRWVGNESGYAGDPCWATYDPVGEKGDAPAPGYTRYAEGENGHRLGKHWLPAEVDVSIRPGWFWHPAENDKVRDLANLKQLYFNSVGRGASFLLNVPPDRRGQIHEQDAASLKAFGDWLRATFKTNLAKGAETKAENVRGNSHTFGPAQLFDGKPETYWATDDNVTTSSVEFELKHPVKFNVIRIAEAIALGQRVDSFAIDAQQDGAWKEIGQGTSIGAHRLVHLASPVSTTKVRLRITGAQSSPAIAEFGLYLEPGA
jgi:alpha-L-fucosidase